MKCPACGYTLMECIYRTEDHILPSVATHWCERCGAKMLEGPMNIHQTTELYKLAQKVVARSKQPVDVMEWARRLAGDVAHLTD